MSYNIDTVSYLKGKLTIKRADVHRLAGKYENESPEDCFLYDLDTEGDPKDDLVIENPSWRGESSGYFYDKFLEVLKFTYGEADLLLIWEGGDSVTGLKVRNGTVTEAKVKQILE